MSDTTDKFEEDLANKICDFSNLNLPTNLPLWVQNLGITSSNKITKAYRMGASGQKTDIVITFDNGAQLKVSAKMSSAHYFGNWYSHNRFINEFGNNIFQTLTADCTKWANNWIKHNKASLFVGVSICFGKRTGNTSREFTDIFTVDDIIKIVAGVGNGIGVANCLYSSSKLPKSIDDLFQILKPIDNQTIIDLSKNFKIAYRPINPSTEGSNRGKCTYTEFVPYKPLASRTEINTLDDLRDLGKFHEIPPNSLNHNRILDNLETCYNIFIERKQK